MPGLRIKRGTRSQIDTAAGSSGLAAGEPYLVTDEDRIAIGLGATTYASMAKLGEPPRVQSVSSASTITPASASDDMVDVTALATNPTFAAPSGSPANGQKLLIRIKDNGTSRTLTWNAIYAARGASLPTATTAGKTHYVGLVYNSNVTKWDCVASTVEA